MINTQLKHDFELLTEKNHQMFIFVFESIKKTKKGLQTQNKDIINQIIDEKGRISLFQVETIKTCEQILLRWQPVLKGLRVILSVSMLSSVLEKIFNLIIEINKTTLKYTTNEYIYPVIDIEKLFDLIITIFNVASESFLQEKKDDELGFLENFEKVVQLSQKIINDLMKIISDKNTDSEQILDLIFIAKNLKLISELIMNIITISSYKKFGWIDKD